MGITEQLITQYEDMEEVLQKLRDNRVTTATNMNMTSSRSHAMLRLTVESREALPGEESGVVGLEDMLEEMAAARKCDPHAGSP